MAPKTLSVVDQTDMWPELDKTMPAFLILTADKTKILGAFATIQTEISLKRLLLGIVKS